MTIKINLGNINITEKVNIERLNVGIFANKDGNLCSLRNLNSYEMAMPLPWSEVDWDGERIYCVANMENIPWRSAVHTYTMLLNIMPRAHMSIPDLVKACHFDYSFYPDVV